MSWIFAGLLSAAFAALVAIFGKLGITKVDTTVATTVRAVVMAVFLVVVSLALGKGQDLFQIRGRVFLFIVLSGLAGALSWLAYFFALRLGPASAVAALDRLSVVFVFVLAVLFLGEIFSWKGALGAVLITIGAILLSIR